MNEWDKGRLVLVIMVFNMFTSVAVALCVLWGL